MKFKLLLIAICLGTFVFSQSSMDNKFTSEVRKMIELSGSEKGFDIVINEMVTNAKEFRPDIPAGAWAEIESELKGLDKNELYAIIIPIYAKHFNIDEIKEINKFLGSPIGKKFSSKLPLLTQESMKAAKIWGITIAKKISERLKEKGY